MFAVFIISHIAAIFASSFGILIIARAGVSTACCFLVNSRKYRQQNRLKRTKRQQPWDARHRICTGDCAWLATGKDLGTVSGLALDFWRRLPTCAIVYGRVVVDSVQITKQKHRRPKKPACQTKKQNPAHDLSDDIADGDRAL